MLLHEYDGLRAEILSRANSRFGLVGLAAVAATLLGTTRVRSTTALVWIFIGLGVGAAVIWVVFRIYINRCAARLAQIERQINRMLGTRVLAWETHSPGYSWRDIWKRSSQERFNSYLRDAGNCDQAAEQPRPPAEQAGPAPETPER